MDKRLAEIFKNINQTHGDTLIAARKMAVDIVRIGIALFQVKEVAGHGNFEKLVADNCYKISDSCRCNYMRLAKKLLVEKTALALESPSWAKVQESALLKKGDMEVLAPNDFESRAKIVVDEMSWFKLPFTFDELVGEIKGRDFDSVFQEYGVTHKPKPDGGFRPDRKVLQDWLKEHYPELQGKSYDDLPATVQREFKKQYKGPKISAEDARHLGAAAWNAAVETLAELFDAKKHMLVDAKDWAAHKKLFKDIIASRDGAHTARAKEEGK